jgi:hypothetical protein
MDNATSNAFDLLREFTSTGQLKYLRDAAKILSKYNVKNIDKSDPPCGTCIFHKERLKKFKNMFTEEVFEPSHCVLSNIMGTAYKWSEAEKKNQDKGYVISCYGSERENWIEPPNSSKRFKLEQARTDVIDKMFDMAIIYTEMTKFIAAIEELGLHEEAGKDMKEV